MPLRVLDAVEEANDAQKHRLFAEAHAPRSASVRGQARRRLGARVQAEHRRHARGAVARADRGAARGRRDGRRARSGGDARDAAPHRRPDRLRRARTTRRSRAPTRSSSSPTGTSTAIPTSRASRRRSSRPVVDRRPQPLRRAQDARRSASPTTRSDAGRRDEGAHHRRGRLPRLAPRATGSSPTGTRSSGSTTS